MKTHPLSSPLFSTGCFLRWICLLSILLTGCREKQTSTLTTTDEKSLEEWDFQAFPQQKQLILARLPAQIIPAQIQYFYAPDNGSLILALPSFEMKLTKGTLWAEFEPAQLEAESALLEKRAQILARKREHLESIEQPKKQLELKEAEEKLLREIALYEALASAAHPPELLHQIVPETNSQSIEELLKQKKAALSLTQKERLEWASGPLTQARLEWEAKASEQTQAELQFAKRLEYFQMRMRFDGELQVNLEQEAPIEPQRYRVKAGQLIGIARSPDQLDAEIAIHNATWQTIPHNQLSYQLVLPSGITLVAHYHKKHLVPSNRGNELTYYFRIEFTDTKQALNLSDSTVNGSLVMTLDQDAYIVPKIELLKAFPKEFANGNWSQGIALLWPNSQLIGEGQTQLAIHTPDL